MIRIPHYLLASLALLICVLAEYYFFAHYILQNIVPVYPMGIDQANYLYASYKLYETSLQQGFIGALQQHPLAPTSFLFTVQAAAFFLLFGASRFSALSLNFLYFAAMQACAVYTIKSCTGRYSLAFLFIGLLLSTEIFLDFGGAVDFRIDFMALCGYGMWVCAVLRAKIFLNRKWTLISAGLAILLISIRFLAAVYIVGIVGSLLLYYVFQWFYQSARPVEIEERLKNVILFGVIVSVVLAPLLWWHRELLFSYYIYGHLFGPEKWVRAKFVGITSGIANVLFYPRVLWDFFLSLQTVIEVGFVLTFFWVFSRVFPADRKEQNNGLNALVFLLLCMLWPLIFLTADMSKSTIVPGIIIVPFLLGITWLCWFWWQHITASLYRSCAEYALVLFCLLSGGGYYANQMFKGEDIGHDVTVIARLINDIGDYATTAGWHAVYAAEDKYTDFFAAIPAFYYETHHVLLAFTPAFGAYSQLIVPNQQVALQEMAKLNVFLANTSDFTPNSLLLFEQSIVGFRWKLQQVAAKRMVRMASYHINQKDYVTYVGP